MNIVDDSQVTRALAGLQPGQTIDVRVGDTKYVLMLVDVKVKQPQQAPTP